MTATVVKTAHVGREIGTLRTVRDQDANDTYSYTIVTDDASIRKSPPMSPFKIGVGGSFWWNAAALAALAGTQTTIWIRRRMRVA